MFENKFSRFTIGLALVITMSSPTISFAQSVDDITFMTESYPPYNFIDNDQLQGVSVDLMAVIFKKLKSKLTRDHILLLPWARGYRDLLTKKNTSLFAVTRTEEREHKFKWVGPITSANFSLIARADKNIKINSIQDINQFTVGAVNGDWGERLLINAGIDLDKLQSISGQNVILRSIKKLDLNRIDLFSHSFNSVKWELSKNKLSTIEYEMVYVLDKSDLYYAFHVDTPDKLIQQFQNALEEIKQQGEHKKILKKYFLVN